MKCVNVVLWGVFAHLPILLGAADVFTIPTCSIEIGDVVFRRGQGPWTPYFIDCSSREKRFSHVGIVVSNKNEVTVAHAEANDWTGVGDVHLQSLDGFLSGALEQAVFRYQGDKTARIRIASEAEKMLGIQFDRLFDMSETNRLYCTEFVRLAVNRAVGYELIGFTTVCGHPVVAIDDIYRRKFIRIYDSMWTVTNDISGVERTME